MNNILQNLSWRDLVDIAFVWLFMYNALLLLRGTRAVQILVGLMVLLLLQGAAWYFKLQAIYFLVRALVVAIVVALPIVFQPELRRALMQLGALETVAQGLDLTLVTIVAEPYALARCLSTNAGTDSGAIFIDIGGGTLDTAIVEYRTDEARRFGVQVR